MNASQNSYRSPLTIAAYAIVFALSYAPNLGFAQNKQGSMATSSAEVKTQEVTLQFVARARSRTKLAKLPLNVFEHSGVECTSDVVVNASATSDNQALRRVTTGSNGTVTLKLESTRLYRIVVDTSVLNTDPPQGDDSYLFIPYAFPIVLSVGSPKTVWIPLAECHTQDPREVPPFVFEPERARDEMQYVLALIQNQKDQKKFDELKAMGNMLEALLGKVATIKPAIEIKEPPRKVVPCEPAAESILCEFPVQWCTPTGPFNLLARNVKYRVQRRDRPKDTPCFFFGNQQIRLTPGNSYRVTAWVDLPEAANQGGRNLRPLYGFATQPIDVVIPVTARSVFRHYLPGLFGRELTDFELANHVRAIDRNAKVDENLTSDLHDLELNELLNKTRIWRNQIRQAKPEDFADPRELVRTPIDIVVLRTAFQSGANTVWSDLARSVQQGENRNTTIWAIVDTSTIEQQFNNWPAKFRDVIALQSRPAVGGVPPFGLLGRTPIDGNTTNQVIQASVDQWLNGGAAGVWLDMQAIPAKELIDAIVTKAHGQGKVVFASLGGFDLNEKPLYSKFDFVTTRFSQGDAPFKRIQQLQADWKDPKPGYGIMQFSTPREQVQALFDSVVESRVRALSISDRGGVAPDHFGYYLPSYWSDYVKLVDQHNAKYRSNYLTSLVRGFGEPPPEPSLPIDVLVPSYFFKQAEFDAAFRRIFAEAKKPGARIWSIVNPQDGPGQLIDPRYPIVLREARRTGVNALAYIAVGTKKQPGENQWTLKTHDELVQEVDRWLEWYHKPDHPLSGFFLDNMPDSPDAVPDLKKLREVLDQRIPGCYVVGNPGKGIDVKLAKSGVAETYIVNEMAFNANDDGPVALPDWAADQPKRVGVLVHSAPQDLDIAEALDKLLGDRSVKFAYVADQRADMKEWTQLATFWEAQVQWVRDRNRKAALPK
jgi:hypothetical protein